ncbi:MAG: hypothetical protein NC344_06505 [Bacteroidales bacterium]|nr:hypothetical protein [Bacteroidales bacterium]MCM1147470.1 hypothetical protein [Bacteroidales bacterium]MCM1206139.1 hypothetical protein [Bacillota bacterium]MCM1510030.1 hypothetical protein [Clostridium sp.]
MKKCVRCHTENPEEAVFCRHCGSIFKDGDVQKSLVASCNLTISELKYEVSSLIKEKTNLIHKLDNANEAYRRLSRKQNVRYITHIIYITVITICSIAVFMLFKIKKEQDSLIADLRSKNESQVAMLDNSRQQIRQLESNSKDLNTTLNLRNDEIKKLSSAYPFIITSVDIKNQGEEYGSTIYAQNTTFIYDRINIKSHYTGSVTIYVKFYRPNGELSANDNSPSGYSYSQQIDLTKGMSSYTESTGWGNKNKGFWKSGQYYMEFWYNNKCFYRKGFYIRSL